jgi:hypothetical protein
MYIAVRESSSKVVNGEIPDFTSGTSSGSPNAEKEGSAVSKTLKEPTPSIIKEAPNPIPGSTLRAYKSEGALKTVTIPSPRIADPLRAYRIPARTKVTMTELLNRMGCRSLAGSPVAFKNSKRVWGKIAPLHPTRRTPPPPPPRVARVQKKTKAQRDEEALWEIEWEEQYGEAWYEMSEEEKERLRKERRDLLWVED